MYGKYMQDDLPAELPADQLAALLCARLCHDLVSPVSALGAALSVFDDPDSADMHEDAMELVRKAPARPRPSWSSAGSLSVPAVPRPGSWTAANCSA